MVVHNTFFTPDSEESSPAAKGTDPKSSVFSKLEETRATLESHLGLDVFLEAYQLIQVGGWVRSSSYRWVVRFHCSDRHVFNVFCPERGVGVVYAIMCSHPYFGVTPMDNCGKGRTLVPRGEML